MPVMLRATFGERGETGDCVDEIGLADFGNSQKVGGVLTHSRMVVVWPGFSQACLNVLGK